MTNLENPDLDTQIEFLCIDTLNLWRNKLGNFAKNYDLSRMERRIIMFIGRYPGIRQTELATMMDVEPQSLTRVLENMEQKNWIIKQDDSNDKRAKSLILADEGRTKLKDVLLISGEIRPQILKNLPLEDKTTLFRIMSRIKENIKEL